MAQSTTGGGKPKETKGEVQTLGKSKLVVENVEVIKRRVQVDVPELVVKKEETIKFIPKEVPTTKYITREEDTTKYNTKELPTTKYNVEEQKTIKYVPEEVKCEKPVLYEKPYEKPVVNVKEYTIVTYKDIEAIRELMELAPELLKKLREIKEYEIVKEIVKVPQINYIPTTIKRVKSTGELIDDADRDSKS